MSTWAEQRRADRVADREQARLDAAAADERARADRDHREALARQARTERRDVRDARQAKAKARRATAAAWLAGHAADLLVYPLALVSAAMAVPAMARYGHEIYGDATGYVLPVLSELGMWAFAFAVMVSRHRHPDRPTVMLTAGIGVFAAVGAALNFLHGLDKGLTTALVMAVVSVAGVVAHQLVVAAPPRSRADRSEQRLARLADRRVAAARRLAVRHAVVELAADGTASLVHVPGRYALARGRLVRATVPGLPVAPAGESDWDDALAALVDGGGLSAPAGSADPTADRTTEADLPEFGAESGHRSGGVATVDPPPPAGSAPSAPPVRRPIDPHARRALTPEQALKAARRLARSHGQPVTAAQLRAALRIGATTARTLRDRVNAEIYGASS